MIFCTLLNRLFLPQGIALYRSLERTASRDFLLYVLCIDDVSADELARLRFPKLHTIRLDEIDDVELKAERTKRSIGEFCWTCTAPLLLHVQDRHPPDTVVAYVDADIRFFSDPAAIFDELGDGSIFIHEHDFAPQHAHLRAQAGRFNVGVTAVRNNDEGRVCLDRWRAQCLTECVMDPLSGKCGDQHYLDEWPSLYGGLVISKNPGVGVAPWNIPKHQVRRDGDRVTVDGRPLVFYHYHALRLLRPRLGVRPALLGLGYFFSRGVISSIYRPYVHELWRALNELDGVRHLILNDLPGVLAVGDPTTNQQLMLTAGDLALPAERNSRLVKNFFGLGFSHAAV
jgi:hypothetical protein